MYAASLRALILTRYTSIHAFCRAHPELKRSTVYLVVSGRYPGNIRAQATRIRQALEEGQNVDGGAKATDPAPPKLSLTALTEAFQNIRCGHCRRLDRRGCLECRTQTEREVTALHEYIFYPQ